MRNLILSPAETQRAITRIASEISERNRGCDNLIVVGILTGGVPLARLITDQIERLEGVKVPIGTVDITLYRDDLSQISELPVIGETELPSSIDDSILILVDDVLFTGRTVRAAINHIMDFGRPNRIELAVLIDRGGRELPIQPDFVGVKLDIGRDYLLEVTFDREGGYVSSREKTEL